MADPIHETHTRRSSYQYLFSEKHHGSGTPDDARWLEALTREEEFSVFDDADWHQIADPCDRLYGVLGDGGDGLRDLGTWQQQIAEFPFANAGIPWHGYPLWPVNKHSPSNRRSERVRPTKEVFILMEQTGLITSRQRKRLYKGDHV
jgi:hypothetical protein